MFTVLQFFSFSVIFNYIWLHQTHLLPQFCAWPEVNFLFIGLANDHVTVIFLILGIQHYSGLWLDSFNLLANVIHFI